MIVFPNAKINLGLRILQKRTDGYHDLSTIFIPVPLCDILEIIALPGEVESSSGKELKKSIIPVSGNRYLTFVSSGITIDGSPENNLIVKAFMKFFHATGINDNYYIHLHKKIPTGAGLGGGSSDAAFALMTLNNITGKKLGQQQLHDIAAELGSDCPFFLINKPCIGNGKGELLNPVRVNLSGYNLIIVMPDVSVSTKTAFKGIVPSGDVEISPDILLMPVASWKDYLKNDFEKKIFTEYPKIKEIKEKLVSLGAVYASLTGSGAAVYGLFNKNLPSVDSFPGCKCFSFSQQDLQAFL